MTHSRERSAESDDDLDDWDDDPNIGGPGLMGCYNCDDGWLHGCCDDLCRGSVEAEDCDNARPCPNCNRDGLYWP